MLADVEYDLDKFKGTAVTYVVKALRSRNMEYDDDLVADLAQEVMTRSLEKWNRSDQGPIVLVRWKALDVVKEEAERRRDAEVVGLSQEQMKGVW